MICYACNKNYPQADPEPFWICLNCKQPESEMPDVRFFWYKPVGEQMHLSNQYGEPPKPFTQEELDEMEGCGC